MKIGKNVNSHMKNWKLKFIGSLFPLLFICGCYNPKTNIDSVEKKETSPGITIHELKQHVAFLASDSLKGRKPGTKGGQQAAEYIKNEISKLDLELLGNNGFQFFDVVTSVILGENNKLSFSGFTGTVGEDFIPFGFSKNDSITGEVVFAGYGFDVKTDSISWNDYSGLDVTGKWVMVLRGDPEDNPHGEFAEHSSLRKKAMVARDKGAAGILFVSGVTFDENDDLIELYYDQSQTGSGIPVLHIKRSVADVLLRKKNYTIKSLESNLIQERVSQSFVMNKIVTVVTDLIQKRVRTQNVLAMLPGTDPALIEEFIVIGAHYDHLGFGGSHSGSLRPDSLAIHNGADDNASGVAAIIEIMEELSFSRQYVKRSVLFIAFGAEESGLLGSKYFTKNSLVDLNQIKLMINLDMVGRMNPDTKSLIVGGTGTGAGLSDFLKTNLQNSDLDVSFSSEGYGPSDHSSFYVEDIPVLFFFSGSHQDYHTPEDDSYKINYAGLKYISEIVYDVVVNVANHSDNFVFQEAGPKEQSRGRRRFKVTLGILPDYTYHESPGLRVDGVLDGRPAKKAGMTKGDIITAIDGEMVGDIYDYMYRLEKLKAGQKISVDVLRNGKKIVLSVDL